MTFLFGRRVFSGFFLVFVAGALLAQPRDIAVQNWTVPPYQGASSAQGGLTTMSDVTPGIAFVGVAPCRLVDTRAATLPNFPAGYGPPALAAGGPRNFDLNSDPQCPGIPAGVDSYSLNVTVTNTQGPGFILIYPQGGAQPTVSTLNYTAGQTVANAASHASDGIDANSDLYASEEYRRHLAQVHTSRAIAAAAARAQ